LPKVLIKNIGDAQRKLAKVIHQYEQDEIKTEKFRSLVYGISKYIEAIYRYDIETRLATLEETLRRDNELLQ
jgi:hypothetical protein